MTARITDLFVYPVKSCRGIRVETIELHSRGFANDRLLMLVDSRGRFISQRERPRLALVLPRLESDRLHVAAPGMDDLDIPIIQDATSRPVTVWDDVCQAIDQGSDAAAWFTEYLKTPCKLMRISDDFRRRVDPDYAASVDDEVGLADAFPLLVISQESLDDLNRRLQVPLPMDRFRPNLVVAGCQPFDEDKWDRVRFGAIECAVVKPCVRCSTTTVDQLTAAVGKEPLTTLATYRRLWDGGVIFGQNAVPVGRGILHVGDSVVVGTLRAP